MAFTRWQYPFDQYKETVAELKRDLDRRAASTYPMIARVTDSKDQVLSEAKYKNVWDRKPKYTDLVTEDWDAPITVAFVDVRDELLGRVELEKVTCRPPEVQLDCQDFLASEE